MKEQFSKLMVSKRPCRLTMRRPNENAKDLFVEIKKEILADRTNCQKYGCIGGWSVVGLVFFGLAVGNAVLGAFVALFVMVGIGTLFHYAWQEDAPSFKTDDNGCSKPRRMAAEKLEARIEKSVETFKPCLSALQHAPQVICASSLNQFVDKVFPNYQEMNVAGCVPKSMCATYALAWTVLASHYEKSNHYVASSHPRFQKIKDLHDKWIELIVKESEAARKITAGMDNQRLKARKQAMNQGIDMVTGMTGIYSSVEVLKSIYDIKGSIDDIREVLKDSKGVKTDSLEPRTGIHDITRRRIYWVCLMITVIFAPFIVLFAALEVPEGAWAMAGVWVFMLIAVYWISTRYGNSFNALEDLHDVELYLRQSIRLEIEKNPIPGQEQLCAVTNILRDQVMDAYYDTLGIHLQTEMLTFGTVPSTSGEPSPLFWTQKTLLLTNGSATGQGQTTAILATQQTTASTGTEIVAIETGSPDDDVGETGCPDDDLEAPTPPLGSPSLSQSGRQSSFGLIKPESRRGTGAPTTIAAGGAGAPPFPDDDDMPSNPHLRPPAPVDDDDMPSNPHLASRHAPAPASTGDIEYGSA